MGKTQVPIDRANLSIAKGAHVSEGYGPICSLNKAIGQQRINSRPGWECDMHACVIFADTNEHRQNSESVSL